MRYIRVTSEDTAEQICEAIVHLRTKQLSEVGEEAALTGIAIDDLLERLPRGVPA